MTMLFVYLFSALCISFLCSVLEAVLLSAPPSYAEVLRTKSPKWAEMFNKMKSNVENPLAAILSLNTIAHTVGAAGVGAQSLELFGSELVGLTSAILTVLILLFSELLPKSIGTRYWKSLLVLVCYITRVLVVICYPFVILSSLITKIFKNAKNLDPIMSREEVEAAVSIGKKEGVIMASEAKSLESLLEVGNMRARDIMTPRTVAVTESEDASLEEFFRKKHYLKYSRIPIYSGNNKDAISGYVLLKSVFMALAQDRFKQKLSELKRDILIVPDSQMLPALWEQMRKRKEQIAMVVDEYGTFVGLLTLEDLIETMLGYEIVDEKDTITDLREYARNEAEAWRKSRE